MTSRPTRAPSSGTEAATATRTASTRRRSARGLVWRADQQVHLHDSSPSVLMPFMSFTPRLSNSKSVALQQRPQLKKRGCYIFHFYWLWFLWFFFLLGVWVNATVLFLLLETLWGGAAITSHFFTVTFLDKSQAHTWTVLYTCTYSIYSLPVVLIVKSIASNYSEREHSHNRYLHF